jgi:hypothetical protein
MESQYLCAANLKNDTFPDYLRSHKFVNEKECHNIGKREIWPEKSNYL